MYEGYYDHDEGGLEVRCVIDFPRISWLLYELLCDIHHSYSPFSWNAEDPAHPEWKNWPTQFCHWQCVFTVERRQENASYTSWKWCRWISRIRPASVCCTMLNKSFHVSFQVVKIVLFPLLFSINRMRLYLVHGKFNQHPIVVCTQGWWDYDGTEVQLVLDSFNIKSCHIFQLRCFVWLALQISCI